MIAGLEFHFVPLEPQPGSRPDRRNVDRDARFSGRAKWVVDARQGESWVGARHPHGSNVAKTSAAYAAVDGDRTQRRDPRLLDGRHFAVLATINPDGGPQTSAMWVARDGDDVLFSTVAGRRKHRNLERDPRASVTVIDSEDPYNYVELRGRVTQMEEDIGRAFDTGLSWKYDGRDPDPDRPGAVRLILRMSVEKATGYAA